MTVNKTLQPTGRHHARFWLFCILIWAATASVCGVARLWEGAGSAAVCLGALALIFEGRHLRALMRLRGFAPWVGFSTGVGMALATHIVYVPLASSMPAFFHDTMRLYAALGRLPPPVAAVALLPIILGEEMIWRGVVQTAVARRLGGTAGIVGCASLYALAHAPAGSPVLVLAAFACGLVWSALRRLTFSLTAPLCAHLVWDVLVLIVFPV